MLVRPRGGHRLPGTLCARGSELHLGAAWAEAKRERAMGTPGSLSPPWGLLMIKWLPGFPLLKGCFMVKWLPGVIRGCLW